MMKGRFRFMALAMVVIAILAGGCFRFKQVRPVSAAVESIAPSGLRSVVVTMAVEIDNPAPQITLRDIAGVVSHSGKVLGRVVVDPFILEAKTLEKYHLRATVSLDREASLFDVMSLTRGSRWEECLIDVHFKATLKGGISKKMSFEQIPLKSLMKM